MNQLGVAMSDRYVPVVIYARPNPYDEEDPVTGVLGDAVRMLPILLELGPEAWNVEDPMSSAGLATHLPSDGWL
jgi:hypothetical protein